MANKGTYILLALVALVAFPLFTGSASYIPVIKGFIPLVEGFSATPVWDYRQWSWGYGTAAGYNPDQRPPGTITREKAMQDALKVISGNYNLVAPMLTRQINSHQWAALLSLLYNLGPGRASAFVPFINAGDDPGLFAKMRQYVYAGGVRNQGLVNRRELEVQLWQGRTPRAVIGSAPAFSDRVPPELITDENGN